MPDKPLDLRKLARILESFGIERRDSRGKGSHLTFFGEVEGQRVVYVVPNRKELPACYVRGARKRFRLRPADGVSDRDFYSRA